MKHMAWKLLLSVGAFVVFGADQSAQAQMLMGSAPYNFPARNNSFAAQAQITQQLGGSGDGSGGSGGGLGALQQYVYSSSSTSIGNYNSVTVGNNSQVTVKGDQDNNGNQGADASTEVSIGDKYSQTRKGGYKGRKGHHPDGDR